MVTAIRQSSLCYLRPWGGWVPYANVGSKLFVTFGFVFSLHFVKRMMRERTSGTKLPATLGATKALEILALNPFQTARHTPL
jgi:hypothetical protein